MKGTKARKILLESDLAEGNLPKYVRLAGVSKAERQMCIRKMPDSLDAKVAAIIEIQRVFRGYCSRCRLLNTLDPVMSHTAIYSSSKHHMARIHDVRTPSPVKSANAQKPVKSSARLRLEQRYQTYLDNLRQGGSRKPAISFEEFCAREIQLWWSRRSDKSLTPSDRQGPVKRRRNKPKPRRAVYKPKPKREGPLLSTDAATIIQRAWRRHIDVQVYRYYRDLINFRNRGDPAMMLRCINPQEAKILDAAAGIHIKFRLAGEKFPPNIYYKIYTHRPIQDLCANSPKDYTRPDAKRKMAKDVHNKGDRVPKPEKKCWYQRKENNGWRLVSDRLITNVTSDPVTWETSQKTVTFHHNKLQRKQDVEKKKKTKKIDWMKKMYREGQLEARSDDPATIDLIEGAAEGLVATVDRCGPAAVHDWEVDELLDWTTSLNFDDYWDGWKDIATSDNSNKSKMFSSSAADPYEVTVTTGSHGNQGNHGNASRWSQNTPISIANGRQ